MNFFIFNGTRWDKFYNYTQLINCLSLYQRSYGCPPGNSFLELTSPTGQDYSNLVDWHGNPHFVKRDHRVTQEDGISIYCKRLINDVRDWRYVESIEKERLATIAHDPTWQRSRTRGWRHNYRKPHHWGHYNNGAPQRDRRAAADPEHAPFIRASRNLRNLPSRYDDIWHKCSCGWKNQGKYRHQWEHNVINSISHSYNHNIYI